MVNWSIEEEVSFKRRFGEDEVQREWEGCPERFDWEFMKFIWNFNKNNRPGLIALLDQVPDGITVQHFRRPREAADYMRALEEQKEEVA